MSEKHNIKLIVIDLDNTLLKDDKTISGLDRETLEKCLKNNIDIIVASGRFLDSHKKILKELDLDLFNNPQIAEGGGLIYSENGTKFLGKLEKEKYLKILQKLKDKNVIPFVSDGINIYYEDNGPLNKIYGFDNKTNMNKLKKIDDLSQVKEPLKFILYCEDQETLKLYTDTLEPETKAFISAKNIAEITSTHLDKWYALKEIINEKGIQPEEIAAIGDSGNDLLMIKNSGLGLSVSNALPEVLDSSDYISKYDNNHNAVSQLIEEYIL